MNIEKLAARFMGNLLANPLIDKIEIPDGEDFYEVIAKRAIKAAYAFKKELKAGFIDAEDAIIVE